MILKTRQAGDPALRRRAKPVTKARLATKEIQDLIDSMVETLRDYPGAGLDRHGKSLSMTADGWHARILQHEADHLVGEIYTDKMNPRSFISEKSFAKDWSDKLENDLEFFHG